MTEIDNKKYFKLLADYEKHCSRIALATTLDINESASAKMKRIKDLEKEYTAWFEYYFPNFGKKKCASFHKELAADIINNKRIRELAEMYRSAGKSVHIDMGIPLYLYLVKNDLKFMLLIGETEEKAAQLLSGIQAELQYNNRIKADYGEKHQKGNWQDGNFTTTDGVKFMSLGFGQNPRGAREQGERPDYIVVDDVDSKKHVNNDRMMREAVDYITEDVWGCFDTDSDATERFVFANNNFHKNSITNRLREFFTTIINRQKEERKKGQTTKIKFKILRVCAVKNLTTFEPTWPEKTTAEYWKEKYKNTPERSFLREYMHVHIEDGKIFKFQDILYRKVLPLEKYDALVFYGDLSYKATGDFKGLVLVGKIGKEYHIINVYLRQASRKNLAEWLYDQYERYKYAKCTKIKYLIEGLFAMDEFVNDFDEEGDKRGYHIPVVADKRPKGDKDDRIESLSSHTERHEMYFNEDLKGTDQDILVDQFLGFEKGSKIKKDGPDAVQGAVSWLNFRTHKTKGTYKFGRRQSFKH